MWCYSSIFSVRQFSTTCGHQAMRQQLEKKKKGWHSYWHLADPTMAIYYCFYCCSDYFRRNSDAHTCPVSLQPHSIAHFSQLLGICSDSVLWLQAHCPSELCEVSLIQALCCMTSRQTAEVHGNLDQKQTVDYSQVSELGHLSFISLKVSFQTN